MSTILSVFNDLDTDRIDCAFANRARSCILFFTTLVEPHHHNPMCFIKFLAECNSVNFRVQELFVRKSDLARMMILKWVSLNITILSNRKNFATFIIDNCGNVKASLSQLYLLIEQYHTTSTSISLIASWIENSFSAL